MAPGTFAGVGHDLLRSEDLTPNAAGACRISAIWTGSAEHADPAQPSANPLWTNVDSIKIPVAIVVNHGTP
jgi:hypothetical protein